MPLINMISMILLDSTSVAQSAAASSSMNSILTIISIVAGALAIIIFLYQIGAFVQRQKDRMSHLESDADTVIKPSITRIETKIEDRLLPAINEINSGISYLKGAMGQILTQDFTESRSPKSLNEKGNKIVKDSGIDTIIDNQFEHILELVRAKGPVNAYQAQEATIEAVKSLATKEDLKGDLEMGSFRSGQEIDIVLYVGAYYIRDRILERLGLLPDDIDNDDPSVSKSPESR
jgi:hypothetical protein